METLLKTAVGEIELQRLPRRHNELLQAWDAADEYLLNYVFEQSILDKSSRLLILNDSFGALAVGLSAYHPVAISDSYLSQQATLINLIANQIETKTVTLNNSLDYPKSNFDIILIKAPKTMALLEDQLVRLQPLLQAKTIVIVAGMVKRMPAAVWKLMGRYLGETKPSLTKKKARLIFTQLTLPQKTVSNPYPSCYSLENTDYLMTNHANVFSRESLDIGTRFLLTHLPVYPEAKSIIDLGCGNGVVGLLLAINSPMAQLHFVDESYMAIASAEINFKRVLPDRDAHFLVTNGLIEFEPKSVDLIVCNPPFHQDNTIGNQLALLMFRQAYQTLEKGGEFWVVGNRHLGYHADLKKLFGGCQEVDANKKFVIWKMVKA